MEDGADLKRNAVTNVEDGMVQILKSLCCSPSLDPLLPTGHYWIRTSTGSAVLVYCDPTRSCDGVTGGHALGQSGGRGQ